MDAVNEIHASDSHPVAVVEQIDNGAVVNRVQVGKRLLFGRSEDCGIVIENRRVSRRHAEIVYRSGQYFLIDLRSSNGTFLNGLEINTEVALSFGDDIEIDDYKFRFVDVAQPDLIANPTSILHRMPTPDPKDPSASRLQAVMAVAARISRSLTPEALFQDVLGSLMGVFPEANRGFILTPDTNDTLRIRSRMTKFEEDNLLARAPVSRFVAEKVMSSGEAMLSLNAADDPNLDPSESIQELQIASLICAPIPTSSGRTQGVVYIDSFASGQPFDDQALEMLATVATIVGQFLENANLQETRLRAELLQKELQLAQDVQRMLLPQQEPAVAGYSFTHEFRPAGVLAGDYIDYIHLPDRRIAFAIGDVTGKGAPAAMMMARMNSAVRLLLKDEGDLATAVRRLDEVLAESNEATMFASFGLAVLNPESHELQFVDAGHLPPLRRRGQEVVECFDRSRKGILLGIGGGEHSFSTDSVVMEPGDSIVMVTDGVTEARNDQRELFGTARLCEAVRAADDDAEAIRESILSAVSDFREDGSPGDDLSIVVIRRNDA